MKVKELIALLETEHPEDEVQVRVGLISARPVLGVKRKGMFQRVVQIVAKP